MALHFSALRNNSIYEHNNRANATWLNRPAGVLCPDVADQMSEHGYGEAWGLTTAHLLVSTAQNSCTLMLTETGTS